MSNVERTTIWQQIQQGVRETERLITRKDYNLVMIKSRQVLEYMVRCMAEQACLVEGDLSDTIDQLYEGRWIDRTTRDNYHTIRILGNKAVHEGDNGAHDANQAFQLLTREVQSFASQVSGGRPSRPAQPVRASGGTRQAGRQTGGRSSSGRSGQGSGRPAQRSGSRGGSSHQGSGRRRRRKKVSPLYYIVRLLVPVLIVVLLVVLISVLKPGKDKEADKPATTPTSVTTAPAPPPPTLPPATTAPPETTAPVEHYQVKGSSVNVRSDPSTTGNSRILGKLNNGADVDYVKRYNNDWAVINYNGQEAFISSQYLEKVERESQGEPEAEQSQSVNGETE